MSDAPTAMPMSSAMKRGSSAPTADGETRSPSAADICMGSNSTARSPPPTDARALSASTSSAGTDGASVAPVDLFRVAMFRECKPGAAMDAVRPVRPGTYISSPPLTAITAPVM